jgi:hypothetical protein
MLGNKRCLTEHRSGVASDEADLTDGQWCPGEGVDAEVSEAPLHVYMKMGEVLP